VNRAATAHHEAGHAVVSKWNRIAVREVTITEDDEALGHTRAWPIGDWFSPDVVIDTRTKRRIEHAIMVLLAGQAAQERFDGSTEGAESDSDMAVTLAMYATGSAEQCTKYIERLQFRTDDLVRQLWRAIEHVAAVLLDEERLSARRFRQVYADAIKSVDTR
jgi:ATP-dependent Zn protease